MDSGGQFIYQLYKWVPGYGQWLVSSLSCINEYLSMDSGGQFTQLYKWVPGYGQWWTVHSAVHSHEYLAMDSGGQFTQLYKWVLMAMDSGGTVHSPV